MADAQGTAPTRIDTQYLQETPEGVELTLSPAGPVPRALAWLIDLALRAVAYMIAAVSLSALGGVGSGVLLIGLFLAEWGYPVYFEYRMGATPGKLALGLTVVHSDSSPLTLASAVLRNLIRFVDFLPVCYLVGLISCLTSARFQRLGDLAADTLVTYRVRKPVRRAHYDVPPEPPVVPLKLEEQRAIVAFAERAPSWTEARQRELASHTGPCTRGTEADRVYQLLAYARFIRGDR